MKEYKWCDYPGDRLLAEHPAGFKIIIPKNIQASGMPLFCPVCDSNFCSTFDHESWEKFQCCDSCASVWACNNVENWKSGWRPTQEEVGKRQR